MFRALTLLVLFAATTMQAQLGPEAYLPKSCQDAAQAAANETSPGAILIAIFNGSYEFVLLGTTYNSGMRLSDGKAIAWFYAYYQANGDSVFVKPFGKTPGSCNDVSQLVPTASVPAEDIGRTMVPNNYIEGAALISALNTDITYTTFHNAYPDSLPSATMLAVAEEESFGYPAGTPFWFVSWVPSSQGTGGLTCIVEALSGTTLCFSIPPLSVADEAAAAGFSLAPNPAFDRATLTLPTSWLGSMATIEAVDVTGTIAVLASDVHIMSPALDISLSSLQSGMYTMRIRNQRQATVIPMSVLR